MTMRLVLNQEGKLMSQGPGYTGLYTLTQSKPIKLKKNYPDLSNRDTDNLLT